MKNILPFVLATAGLIGLAGCASDTTATTSSTRTTYVSSNNDPKDMSTAITTETPAPAPAPAEQDYPSNGIHTNGNLPGAH
jgi:hypothetical protein